MWEPVRADKAGVGVRLTVAAAVASVALLAPLPAAAGQDAATRIDGTANSAALGRDVTVHVVTAPAGSNIYAAKPDARQVPASTMKVVTAANALHAFGPAHRFVTEVRAGTGQGHINLVGGGDPLLTRTQVDRLAAATARVLRNDGVRRVTVHPDLWLFPRPSDGPGWMAGDSPTYAAAVQPLAFYGTYSSNPADAVLAHFVTALRRNGVKATAGQNSLTRSDAPRLAAVESRTVQDAVGVMLRDSENNIAEILFRQVALARGYPATWTSSSAAAQESLRELGVETWRLRLLDGSGLSPKNALTAESLTDLLRQTVPGGTESLQPLRKELPVAGQSGTLTYRFTGKAACARGKVWAKTGSLTGVNTLAGVTRMRDGQWRAFAVMVNRQGTAGVPWRTTSDAIDEVAAAAQGCR